MPFINWQKEAVPSNYSLTIPEGILVKNIQLLGADQKIKLAQNKNAIQFTIDLKKSPKATEALVFKLNLK